MEETTRAELLADPSIILDDKELMESLLTATDIKLGNNVVDLRHVAMSRLTHKLGELEGTHKSVVAAAYQNLLGTKQIHQAVIELMSMNNLDQFALSLKSDLLKILNVDCIFILVGISTMFFFSILSKNKLFFLSYVLFLIFFISLILVPFIGTEVKGSKRWLDIFFLLRFQPIEIL